MAENADELLVIMLEARIAEFERRMAKAERTGTGAYRGLQRSSKAATAQMERDAITAAARVETALANVSAGVGNFAKGLAVGVLATAMNSVAGAARDAIGRMADLADTADRVGMAVEDMQALQFGLKLAGVEADSAAGAMEKFTDSLGDAMAGQGALAERLAAAGIALTDSNGQMRDTLDLLREYADAVAAAPNPAEQMAMVTDAFGRGGKAMVLAMSEGAAGIDAMMQSARDAGTVIDENMIRKAAELDDKFDQWGATISAAFSGAVIDAAEFFGLVNMSLTDAFLDARELAAGMADAAAALASLGSGAAAGAVAALASEVSALGYQYEIGAITAGEYQTALQGVLSKTLESIAGMDDLDAAQLAGIRSEVASLLELIGLLPAAAADAANAVAAIDAPAAGNDFRAPPSGDTSAKTTVIRPPARVGGGGARGGGGGGGGGGAGNGRLEALLRDLQTEREAITAWHTESLALLQSASDAQLEVFGGRHAAIERLEKEHQGRLAQIQEAGAGGALANAQTLFGALATATASGTGKVLRIHKVAAAMETAINVVRAQGQVLADPTLGFWAKLPAVAAIAGAGASLIAALGGGGGGVAASVPKSSGAGSTSSGAGSTSSGAGSTSSASSGAGNTQAPPLRFLASGIDPAKLYQGQALIDLVTDIQTELGQRGMVLEFVK